MTCSKPKFIFKQKVKELHVKLIKNYSELNDIQTDEDKLDIEIINQTRHWLHDYPKALKLYNQAIENYKFKAFERNILDDLRLSLELFLKQVFRSEKSLEHQYSSIGTLVKKQAAAMSTLICLFNLSSIMETTRILTLNIMTK
jgi:hypothetical protein